MHEARNQDVWRETKRLPGLYMRSKGRMLDVGHPTFAAERGGGGRLCAPSLNNERRTTPMLGCGDGIHDPDTGKGRCGKHSCCSCVGLDELESEFVAG